MVRVPAATSLLLGLALALTCTKANAQHTPSLTEVRTAYRAACLAPANSEVVAAFNRTAELWVGSDSTNAFAQGLLATARMMRAETQFNPLAKLQTFLSQRDPLEAAIATDPDHPELRLFRLSIQWSVPFFLDYAGNMDEDAGRVATALDNGYWADDAEQGAFALTFLQHLNDDASKR
ncbi:MAG: hypothetical protein CBD69_010275 [Crocinitomicaceae bacterium TMED209]|nr:MAG: hypothetical protein CBD69_010275 [Crocinitomicaceae bacterium TMED209]